MLYEFTNQRYHPLAVDTTFAALVCVNAKSAAEATFIMVESGELGDGILCIGQVDGDVEWLSQLKLKGMNLPEDTTGFWRGNDFIQVNTRKFKLDEFLGLK